MYSKFKKFVYGVLFETDEAEKLEAEKLEADKKAGRQAELKRAEIRCDLGTPVFTESEKEILSRMMQVRPDDNEEYVNAYWGKVMSYLMWNLMDQLLNSKFSHEERLGYLKCFHALRSLPLMELQEDEGKEPEGAYKTMPEDF